MQKVSGDAWAKAADKKSDGCLANRRRPHDDDEDNMTMIMTMMAMMMMLMLMMAMMTMRSMIAKRGIMMVVIRSRLWKVGSETGDYLIYYDDDDDD